MSTLILALETSCDDTSAAVVADGRRVLSNVVASQVEAHQRFGGVVPEIASRQHLTNIGWVIPAALDEAGVAAADLQGVAVTNGPGLVGSLLVGVAAAKALAFAYQLPLVAVHHVVAHLYAAFLAERPPELPLVALVVSGGHTNILHLEASGTLKLLGATRDDAAGEAFDKVARALGLGYPGGPAVEALAREGAGDQVLEFPRAWLEEGSYDFSFSGLKSAVVNQLNSQRAQGRVINRAAVAWEFQEAVVDVLVAKTLAAAQATGVHQLVLAGGVAANGHLRELMAKAAAARGLGLVVPPPVLCTDNAAMVGCAAYYQLIKGEVAGLDLNAYSTLPLPR